MNSLLRHQSIRKHASQGWRFLICGGMGFIIDLASLTLFVEYFAMNQYLAVVLSSVVGASFVFVANKFFTFRNCEKRYGSQVLKFLLVYGLSLGGNVAISSFLITVGLHYLLAKIIAVGIGAVWNYALSHGFVFKKGEDVDVVIG